MTKEKEKGFWAAVIEKIMGAIFGAAKGKNKGEGVEDSL